MVIGTYETLEQQAIPLSFAASHCVVDIDIQISKRYTVTTDAVVYLPPLSMSNDCSLLMPFESFRSDQIAQLPQSDRVIRDVLNKCIDWHSSTLFHCYFGIDDYA